jgi:hypothetical protein
LNVIGTLNRDRDTLFGSVHHLEGPATGQLRRYRHGSLRSIEDEAQAARPTSSHGELIQLDVLDAFANPLTLETLRRGMRAADARKRHRCERNRDHWFHEPANLLQAQPPGKFSAINRLIAASRRDRTARLS